MRKVLVNEIKLNNWTGPFWFHTWGMYQGDSYGIIEDCQTGECKMAYVGMIRFIEGENEDIECKSKGAQSEPGS